MQSDKEALMAIFSGRKTAERIPAPAGSHTKVLVFPGDRYFSMPYDAYGTGPDAWGVRWTNMGPDPGLDGSTVEKDFRLFHDFADWKEKVVFPDPEKLPVEQIFAAMSRAMNINRKEDVVTVLILSGQFERLNEMIGMEEALCAFYEEPELMHEWMEAMCSYKLKCIDLAVKYANPDIINMHDDWGTASNMFFSPVIWREFIKPNEKRYAQRIHEYGILYRHHSCGYIMQIIPDLVEIGVDILEPVMPCNDVDWVLDHYGSQITVAGGVNNLLIEGINATERDMIAEVHRVIDHYAWKGRYIPDYIPTNAQIRRKFLEEVERYGKSCHR